MEKEFEMITVKEYVEKLNDDDKYILTSVEKYLNTLRKDEKIA